MRWNIGAQFSWDIFDGFLTRGKVQQVRSLQEKARYELEDAPDGTQVAIHATGTPGRFLWWATPIMSGQVRTSIAGDLDRLRACLESW